MLVAAAFCEPVAHAQEMSVTSAPALLELHGIDASQMDRFQDHEPLGPDDEETLIRILQRFPRFPRLLLERWSRQDQKPWTELVAAPHEHRGKVCQIRGRVTHFERSALLPELARRLEFSEYYRVTVRLEDAPVEAVVCARTVPRGWLTADPVGQTVAAVAILLKVGAQRHDVTQFVVAADRVAWYPTEVQDALAILPSHVFLAQHGFDIGLLDQARDENRRPLSLRDRECFYQLLAAVHRTERDVFVSQAQQPLDIIALLREPRPHQGQLLTLDGVARRAVRVRIDEPEDRKRFGLDHYFQIDLFVDLNRLVIKLKSSKDVKEGPVYADSFPVTVCVPSLPTDLHEGDILRENVRIHGVFFKLWTYPSDYVASFDKVQVSPMLIGVEPSMIRPDVFVPGFGIGLAGLAVLSLLAMWWGLSRQPRHVMPISGPPSLSRRSGDSVADSANQPFPEKPDFSNLE